MTQLRISWIHVVTQYETRNIALVLLS